MIQALRHFLLALQFFTRIPVTGRLAQWVGYSPEMLRASTAHFPGVGWLVGGLSAAVLAGLLTVLPDVPAAPWVAAVACTVFSVLLTGAFHEDGLADLADGLGGSYDRERALDIMKDSRIGSFGAIALVLGLFSKLALLALLVQVDAVTGVAACWLAHVVSRTAPLFIIRSLPHVGDTPRSKSKPLADRIGMASLLAGLVWCAGAVALVAVLWPQTPWLAGLLGAVAGWGWMVRLLARRLQGFTGDGLGATQQVCEIGFLLGAAIALGAGWGAA